MIKFPAPVIGPDTVKLPKAPPKFNAPVSLNDSVLFVNVKVPASILILAAELTVIKLDKVLDPLRFLIAPVKLIPVPEIKIGSGITYPVPFIFSAAKLATVVVDAAVLLPPGELLPNPSLFSNCTTPALIFVAPVYEFAPPNINVSALILVSMPFAPDITPLIFIPFTTSAVKVKPAKFIPPVAITNESVLVPDKVPLTMVALAPNVIGPVQVFLFLIFIIAP